MRHLLLALTVVALPLAARAEPPRELTEAECLEFAKRIEKSMSDRDPTLMEQSLDLDAMLDKAMAGFAVSPQTAQAFRNGVKKGVGSVPKTICDALGKSGSYRLLRIRKMDGSQHALFRMVAGNGFNYQEISLVPSGAGLKIHDSYAVLSGEWWSNTLRRAYLPIVAEEDKGFLAKLTAQQGDYFKHLPEIQRMMQLGQAGQCQQALAVFQGLPASLKADKNFLLERLGWARQVGHQVYQIAAADIEKACPGDPCLDLVMLSSFVQEKRYDRAFKALDNLEKFTGGDAYLDYQRSELFYRLGDPLKAKVSALKAIGEEATLFEPYEVLITISLEEKDFKETARLLTVIETELKVELSDLKGVKDYEEFVASEAYQPWMASRKK